MKLAFKVEYDGTDYSGFQRQSNATTVQEKIEYAIEKITKSKININYSGRTDAGVHAISQVFDFETDIFRDEKSWIKGLNSNLPSDINIKNVYSVPEKFHSRFSAIDRSYTYLIYNSSVKPLFFNRYCYWVSNNLDIKSLKKEADNLIGEHDFSSFRSSNCNSKNPIKIIKSIDVKKKYNFIILNITANAFLQNMMRIIVGTLIDIAKNESKNSIKEILEIKNRSFAGKTAPPTGLFFLGPSYKEIESLKTDYDLLNRIKI